MTHFRGFWLFLGSSMVLGHFWAILGRFGLLLPACLLAVGVFFSLLCLALAALAALACFGLLGLLWLLALSVPLLLRFELMLVNFSHVFAFFRIFVYLFRFLKRSSIFF